MSEAYQDSRGLLSLVDYSAVGIRDHISRLAEGILNVAPLDYGVFVDLTTQTNLTGNVVRVMSLGTTLLSDGVTIESGSEITVSTPGLYNIQFSAQIKKSGGTKSTVDIWYAKNGDDVADSNTRLSLESGNHSTVAAWNFFEELDTGDHAEIRWASADTNVTLPYIENLTSPVRPNIPSVIVTVQQIRATV